MCGCSSHSIKYPVAPTDNITDTYFDTIVADPYRPLENDTAEHTLAWVKEQNKITGDYMAAIPFRNDIKSRLQELTNYSRRGSYWRDNDGKYYYYENDGLQNQSILYRTDSIGKPGEVFLDPNKLSDDGTVALTGISQSNDGKYTAYTISRNGSDWTEIYVMDTATGNLLDDHIEWAKFTGAQWRGDGFYYSAYPRPEKGKEFSNANENHQIYYHRIGTPQSADRLIYEDPAHPLHFHSAYVTDDEDYLMVIGSGEGFGESLMIKDLKTPGADWKIVEPSQDIELSPLGVFNGKLYLLTTYGAERYRIVTADVNNPGRDNWQTLVPEQDAVIKGVSFTPDNMIITYEKDATNHAYIYDMDGNRKGEIELPGIGTAGIWSSNKYPDIFYTFTSFTSPSAVYAYDEASGNSTLLWSPDINGIDMTEYETKQVWFTSADGTEVPMFITYKKGLELNGKNPTLLYGYGGFNISLTPGFSAMRMLWLENGGVYAMANLRGGGEYGESWHKAGTKMQKLNVFNDFIAAAEYLIDHKYTSPDYLAIQGGSNGGLLVGAVTNMRPDLFKVAIPQVGVMDMMRYHLFTIGWNWASDYGTSADSKEMAEYLLSYSPVHNIKSDGTPYPAILITTADHDDRVVPAHSFKYAATLQAADTGDAPKLIRIESNAGHGAGKPITKSIEENADIYSFIFYNMGITPEKH
ncbi:MAG: prolyl oligopeptidase family serine peptidase [Paramuribaculum sp.]|nr:prolyl oligopeptidase family serine peptidase [Paramuribaculum sp.]